MRAQHFGGGYAGSCRAALQRHARAAAASALESMRSLRILSGGGVGEGTVNLCKQSCYNEVLDDVLNDVA